MIACVVVPHESLLRAFQDDAQPAPQTSAITAATTAAAASIASFTLNRAGERLLPAIVIGSARSLDRRSRRGAHGGGIEWPLREPRLYFRTADTVVDLLASTPPTQR